VGRARDDREPRPWRRVRHLPHHARRRGKVFLAAIAAAAPIFAGFAKAHFDLGILGNGSRMKYVANLLVFVHNVAAAEALVLTRSPSIEFGRDGVRVNCLAPGNTATPMNENLRTEPQYKGYIDTMTARTPSGRTYSKPEEMAQAALYLACDDSRPVHGAILVLDEGVSLGV
jgi:NAD(P)-dependent dehydrogenase (short-subunit alcohol dehydrogenase family)